jgi:archaemetzincin
MRQASPDPVVARRRMLMTMAHELGHALGLAHCIAGSCLMNGSNHLAESDAQPALFCPHCTAKLRALRGIDPARVFCGLVQFFEEQGLTADRDLARKACEALKNGE